MNKEKKKIVPELRFPEFKKDGEWAVESFNDLYNFKITNSFSRDKLNYENGEVKNIHYGDIHTKFASHFDILIESVPYINMDVSLERINNDNYCIEGDLVIADASEDLDDIGKSIEIINLNKEKLLAGLHTLLARPIDDKIKLGFGGHLFKSNGITTQIKKEAQGAKVLGISKARLANLDIFYPKNEKEQQKISNCLSSLDKLITAETEKLDHLKGHKKGLLQQLFPQERETKPQLRFPEFLNDGEWNSESLGSFADVSKLAGYEFTKHVVYQDEGEIIALRGLNIKNNSLDLTDVKYIDNSEFSKLGRSKLYVDDLMFTYIGTIGEVALIKENDKYYLAPNVSRIRFNKEKVLPNFILQYFTTTDFKKIEIAKYISSSSQPALTMANVRKFSIALPPKKEEQQKIADCLSSADVLITAQTAKIEALKDHKKGLMQQLFPQLSES